MYTDMQTCDSLCHPVQVRCITDLASEGGSAKQKETEIDRPSNIIRLQDGRKNQNGGQPPSKWFHLWLKGTPYYPNLANHQGPLFLQTTASQGRWVFFLTLTTPNIGGSGTDSCWLGWPYLDGCWLSSQYSLLVCFCYLLLLGFRRNLSVTSIFGGYLVPSSDLRNVKKERNSGGPHHLSDSRWDARGSNLGLML